MGKLEKKGFKREKFKALLWEVVKCPNKEQLKGKLELINMEPIEAYEDLINRGPKFFYKEYVETWSKFDMMDNNICEIFNSYIRKGREKLFLEMLRYISENLIERMEKQVQLMKKVKDKICPRIRKKLGSIKKNTRHNIMEPVVREISSEHVQ